MTIKSPNPMPLSNGLSGWDKKKSVSLVDTPAQDAANRQRQSALEQTIYIVCVSPQRLLWSGLGWLIDKQTGFHWLGGFCTMDAFCGALAQQGGRTRWLQQGARTLVLLGTDIEDWALSSCIGWLKRQAEKPLVVVLGETPNPWFAAHCHRCGADGHWTKSMEEKTLVQALNNLSQGRRIFFSFGGDSNALLASTAPLPAKLGAKEQEVLFGLAQGQNLARLAKKLRLSSKTVSTHKANAFRKLGIKNWRELYEFAVQSGWMTGT